MSSRTRNIFALSLVLAMFGGQAGVLLRTLAGMTGFMLVLGSLALALVELVILWRLIRLFPRDLDSKTDASPDHLLLLREHLSQVVKAQEDERQRVARELHDQAGQALLAIQLGLERLARHTQEPLIIEELQELRALTTSSMEEIHYLAVQLRPSMLDDLGLIPALCQYARDYHRRTGIPVDLDLPSRETRFPGELETTLFRVIQEGLTNVAKHAMASRATVTLEVKNRDILVRVADNGQGFNSSAALRTSRRHSLGLLGMEERIALLGGQLDIQSKPGQGTTLSIVVPVPAAASSTA